MTFLRGEDVSPDVLVGPHVDGPRSRGTVAG